MSKLLRHYAKGQVYFVASVTHQRKQLLVDHFDLFWEAIMMTKRKIPFELTAWVVLPDHFHFLIDPGDSDLSNIMRRIKLAFSSRYLKRKRMRSGKIWQSRFWDHIIRDEKDWIHHLDYIHYNPVKHGLVQKPQDWKYSSITEYSEVYASDWGLKDTPAFNHSYGE